MYDTFIVNRSVELAEFLYRCPNYNPTWYFLELKNEKEKWEVYVEKAEWQPWPHLGVQGRSSHDMDQTHFCY